MTFSFVGMSGIGKYFTLDILLVLFFTSFTMLFKSNKVTIILLSIMMFFIMALFLVNAHLYKIFGDILSIGYLEVLDEATGVFSWSFINFEVIILGLFVYFLFILSCYIIANIMRNVKYNLERDYIVSGLFQTIFTTLVVGLLLSFNVKQADKNTFVNGLKINDQTYVKTLTKKAFKHYGMLGFFYKDVEVRTRSKSKAISINSNYDSDSQYEGLLKGKNVLTIMGETLQDYVICKELTPNLYKLQQEGLHFTNNYSVNKTDMSEMIGITGSYYSFYDAEYDVDFGIPNVLKGKYKTTYVHDNKPQFYSRDNLMRYFGFENTYFHSDMYSDDFTNDIYPDGLPGWEDNDWHWAGDYTLDSVTIDLALPHLVDENKPFYSFWTSLIMHGPYSAGDYSNKQLYRNLGYNYQVEQAIENKKWKNPLEGVAKYEDYMKYMECAAMDFDKAIGKVLDYLEEKDLLDDTLLVIYGDHEAYYHDIYLKMANTTDITQVDKLYQTTMIMYNKDLNERYETDYGTHEVNTFSSPLIVAPTILDLIGVSFDKNWYANYSIFDTRYIKSFYSYQQSAFMDNHFYSSDLEKIDYASDKNLNNESFLYDSIRLLERLSYIDLLYENSMITRE
jgi:phosphoglycerol transferase MdoB-like AlkP superfamily enzyme